MMRASLIRAVAPAAPLSALLVMAAAAAAGTETPAAGGARARYAPARVRAEGLVEEGLRRFVGLDLAGAVAAFQEAVRLDPAVERGDLLLGLSLLRWGRYEAAVGPLERATRGRDPVLARRHLDRARAAARPPAEPATVLLGGARWREGLGAPVAVAPSGDRVAVADASGGRVLLLDSTGRVTGVHRGLAGPAGIAVAAGGVIWVAEGDADRVTSISPDGHRRSIPADDAPRVRARPAGPRGIALLPGGDLVVADAGGGRLLRYAADGTFRGVVAENLRRPAGLLRLGDGRFLVAEASGPSVAVLARSGEIETRLAHPALEAPAGVAIAGGRLWVADRAGRIIHGRATDTTVGPLEGVATDPAGVPIALDVPTGIASDAHGVLWVAEAGGAVSAFVPPAADRAAGLEILRLAIDGRRVEIWAAVRDARGRAVTGIGRENLRVLETYGGVTRQVIRYDARPGPANRSVWLAVPRGLDEIDAAEAAAIAEGLGEGIAAAHTGVVYAETPSILRTAAAGDDSAALLLLAEIRRFAAAPAATWRPAAAVEEAVLALSRDPRARDVVLFAPPRYDPAGLVEAGRYARTYLVAVHVVDLARTGRAEDRAPLRRLAEETGGRYVWAFGPRGARGLAEAIAARPNPLLVVAYENPPLLRYPAASDVHVTLEVYPPTGADWDRFWYRAP